MNINPIDFSFSKIFVLNFLRGTLKDATLCLKKEKKMSDDDSKVAAANFSNLTAKEKRDWVLAAVMLRDFKKMEEKNQKERLEQHMESRKRFAGRIPKEKKPKESKPEFSYLTDEEIKMMIPASDQESGDQEVALGYENNESEAIPFDLNDLYPDDEEKHTAEGK